MVRANSGDHPANETSAYLVGLQNPVGVSSRTALDHATLPLLATGARRKAADTRIRAVAAGFGLEMFLIGASVTCRAARLSA